MWWRDVLMGRELRLQASRKIQIWSKMNESRDVSPMRCFGTKLLALLYPWKNVKIPMAKCKYTCEESVAKCESRPTAWIVSAWCRRR